MNISWEQYAVLSEKLASSIPAEKYSYLIGILNGANILTGDIAKKLKLPIVWLNPKIPIPAFDYPGLPLIVDEICDTGKTLQHVRQHVSADCAVLHTRVKSSVDFFAEQIPDGVDWVYYPWEMPEN